MQNCILYARSSGFMRAAVKSLEGLRLQFKRTERVRVGQAYQVKIAVTSAAH
jgi:hypothetical protein